MTLNKILSSLGVRNEQQPFNSVAPTQTAIELNETDLGSVSGGFRRRHGNHHRRHHRRHHHGYGDYDDCDDCDYGDCDDCD